ncbi:E3 ubiquitin-protein ligase Highwire/Pam/Rpm-1 [Kalmanozyma brasiliensis GHG001]|uniref:AB hydrolase-1 domain-containing protein n=1 Tax=Kalmanozyma brasiliensis (strain GHG001) TaxID=1365824 RepID=V5GFA2_KALBG|nr:E3 ubiquitin-protein ligase Highwire/Pam/Rpm-1 [Kalmanozyma brasiliensis GHG001]EST04692.1 E3 ubiquitin-protein ligase Highwire/Pam/Rpm-1 [Kalmanozyma brasiliensis GHG001]
MAQLIPGDASIVLTRLLILTVWGITPFSWLALLTRIIRYYLNNHTSYSIDSRLWATFVKHSPRTVTNIFAHLLSPRWRWASTVFYSYCAIEAAFSLYHLHLSQRLQRPGPRPLYGRRFLRSVFAQALQAGLEPSGEDLTNGNAKGSYASAVQASLGDGPVSRRTNGSSSLRKEDPPPSDVRQRLGRLRAASFVPQFVSSPISADDPRALKFQQDQARWFFGVPAEQITRRDVMHWLAWSLFATELEELEAESKCQPANGVESATPSTANSPMPPSSVTFGGPVPKFSLSRAIAGTAVEEQEDVQGVRAREGEWDPTTGDRLQFLEYCLELLETRQGRSYPLTAPVEPKKKTAKMGPRIRMMRLTIDPVRTRTRPLLCYAVTNGLSYLTIRRAIRGGFQMRTEGRLPYLYRPALSTGKDTTPLVVLHGLGIGLAQYSSLLTFFLHSPVFAHRPLIFLLQPNISQSLLSPHFLHPFGHHETTSAFRRILASNNWSCIDVLSHSYGSLVHSWLIKSLGTAIRRSCFVDPVCFQLWVPFVCSNFVYKRARKPIELLMRYFVARELGVANTLCRYFDWSSNILWPNEIAKLQDGKRTRFYLAEEDAILSAKDTLEYLVESGCPRENVHYGKGKAHGEMLMHGGEDFRNVVDWLSMEI